MRQNLLYVLPDNLPPESWRGQAACRGMEISEAMEFFFPKNYHHGSRNRRAQSLQHRIEVEKFCLDGCPVNKACLDYGKATKSSGFWGGRWLGPRRPL